jgi:hypothetical protein
VKNLFRFAQAAIILSFKKPAASFVHEPFRVERFNDKEPAVPQDLTDADFPSQR